MERRFIMISTRLPDVPFDIRYGSNTSLRFFYASKEQFERMEESLSDWLVQLRRLELPYGDRVCGFL